ncbi:uncharacterized protein RSE6_06722 [Rhynchosporium secalis]|uniref:Uncharacterized protein n=1 Tax=Rhynchosporium secalis TaxID=38038 RepID=A0A1E1MB19_RHYSE|nr:uncharacterized protein RSE6_06722 [Rhynchosporium secalis]
MCREVMQRRVQASRLLSSPIPSTGAGTGGSGRIPKDSPLGLRKVERIVLSVGGVPGCYVPTYSTSRRVVKQLVDELYFSPRSWRALHSRDQGFDNSKAKSKGQKVRKIVTAMHSIYLSASFLLEIDTTPQSTLLLLPPCSTAPSGFSQQAHQSYTIARWRSTGAADAVQCSDASDRSSSSSPLRKL